MDSFPANGDSRDKRACHHIFRIPGFSLSENSQQQSTGQSGLPGLPTLFLQPGTLSRLRCNKTLRENAPSRTESQLTTTRLFLLCSMSVPAQMRRLFGAEMEQIQKSLGVLDMAENVTDIGASRK
jgi:hypothetical protein